MSLLKVTRGACLHASQRPASEEGVPPDEMKQVYLPGPEEEDLLVRLEGAQKTRPVGVTDGHLVVQRRTVSRRRRIAVRAANGQPEKPLGRDRR